MIECSLFVPMKRCFVLGWCAAAAVCLIAPGPAGSEPAYANLIMMKVAARVRDNAAAQGPVYSYTKQVTVEDFDATGRLTSRHVHTKPHQSRPVGPSEAQTWSSNHGVNLDTELLTRYDFTLLDSVRVNGRSTFEIGFRAKNPPVSTHHVMEKLLNRTAGTIWVDEDDSEIVKAQLELTEPINLLVLGNIDRLSFGFERVRSADGTWLTTHTETIFKGRKLLSNSQFRHAVDYSDFKEIRQVAHLQAPVPSP
jgi:hypothetical protein